MFDALFEYLKDGNYYTFENIINALKTDAKKAYNVIMFLQDMGFVHTVQHEHIGLIKIRLDEKVVEWLKVLKTLET